MLFTRALFCRSASVLGRPRSLSRPRDVTRTFFSGSASVLGRPPSNIATTPVTRSSVPVVSVVGRGRERRSWFCTRAAEDGRAPTEEGACFFSRGRGRERRSWFGTGAAEDGRAPTEERTGAGEWLWSGKKTRVRRGRIPRRTLQCVNLSSNPPQHSHHNLDRA